MSSPKKAEAVESAREPAEAPPRAQVVLPDAWWEEIRELAYDPAIVPGPAPGPDGAGDEAAHRVEGEFGPRRPLSRGATIYAEPPRHSLRLAILALVVVGGVGRAGAGQALSLSSDLGPGDSYSKSLAYSLPDEDIAMPFEVGGSGSYSFTSAQVALFFSPNETPGPIDILLMADDRGAPGAVLESIPLTFPDGLPEFSLVQADSTLHPALEGGGTYWLGIASDRGAFDGGWLTSTDGQSGHLFARTDGPWFHAAAPDLDTAFRISGAPVAVPEPSALVSAVLGVLALAGFGGHRRRKARATA